MVWCLEPARFCHLLPLCWLKTIEKHTRKNPKLWFKEKKCPDDLWKLVQPSFPHERYLICSIIPKYDGISDRGIYSLPMFEWRAYFLEENLLAFLWGFPHTFQVGLAQFSRQQFCAVSSPNPLKEEKSQSCARESDTNRHCQCFGVTSASSPLVSRRAWDIVSLQSGNNVGNEGFR